MPVEAPDMAEKDLRFSTCPAPKIMESILRLTTSSRGRRGGWRDPTLRKGQLGVISVASYQHCYGLAAALRKYLATNYVETPPWDNMPEVRAFSGLTEPNPTWLA
eukprot:2139431-Amphidinium_carterae.1